MLPVIQTILSTLNQKCVKYLHISFPILQCTVIHNGKNANNHTLLQILNCMKGCNCFIREDLTNHCLITECGVHSKREMSHSLEIITM